MQTGREWLLFAPGSRQSPCGRGGLPIGLAHNLALLRDIAAGEIVRWSDVVVPESAALLARQTTMGAALRSTAGRRYGTDSRGFRIRD